MALAPQDVFNMGIHMDPYKPLNLGIVLQGGWWKLVVFEREDSQPTSNGFCDVY